VESQDASHLEERELVGDYTNELVPEASPTNIAGRSIMQVQLASMKAAAMSTLTLSVSDDLIDTVAVHVDPALAWAALKAAYQSGDQSQVLTLLGQLQTMKLSEGGLVEEYIKRARELKNRQATMGETVSDKSLIQLVLNGLPRSYESTIQTLTHQSVALTFDQISASLLTEAHRREHRAIQLGDEEALAATFNRQASFSQYPTGFGPFHGRGGCSFYRGAYGNRGGSPGRFSPFSPQPPFICYNYGKQGHFARECRQERVAQNLRNPVYANSAEIFDAALTKYYDGYNYGPWYMDSGATGHIASSSSKIE
jgi:hypothetical protein